VFPILDTSEHVPMFNPDASPSTVNGLKELVVMLRDNSGSNTYTGQLKNPDDPAGTWWTDDYRAQVP